MSEDSLRAHTRVLAHDSLRGRRPGTRGERLAAAYLEERLARLGLRPLPGRDGMTLPVPLLAHAFGDSTRMEVRAAGETRILRPPAFYPPGGSPDAFRDFGGELIVAGATPGAHRALEGIDVTGRVVLLAPPWEGAGEVEAELVRRGASGALEVVLDRERYGRLRVVRGPDRYALPAGAYGADDPGRLPRAVLGPDALRVLGVAETIRPGRTLDEALPTGTTIRVHLDVSRREVTGYNVAALLPGSRPASAEEAVVYVAHHDHVGIGQPSAGDSVWNGFVDNAAGVAVVLEVARVLAADPPPRPVVFLFTTAEEQGLLGSTWFVHRAAFPPGRIRAAINVDGGAPAPDVRAWQVAGPASAARTAAAEALRDAGWGVRTRPVRPDSDHWAFHRGGVPALFLHPGTLADGIRPHTPADEWSEDFPFGGLVRYGAAALAVGRRLAEAPLPDPREAPGADPPE